MFWEYIRGFHLFQNVSIFLFSIKSCATCLKVKNWLCGILYKKKLSKKQYRFGMGWKFSSHQKKTKRDFVDIFLCLYGDFFSFVSVNFNIFTIKWLKNTLENYYKQFQFLKLLLLISMLFIHIRGYSHNFLESCWGTFLSVSMKNDSQMLGTKMYHVSI